MVYALVEQAQAFRLKGMSLCWTAVASELDGFATRNDGCFFKDLCLLYGPGDFYLSSRSSDSSNWLTTAVTAAKSTTERVITITKVGQTRGRV